MLDAPRPSRAHRTCFGISLIPYLPPQSLSRNFREADWAAISQWKVSTRQKCGEGADWERGNLREG
eukprot:COSAG02_NODE_14479_length_1267_cov_1.341610_2_plen_65_part_01